MKTTVQVQNIKCGGCTNTISNRLARIHGIRVIQVQPETGEVTIEHHTESGLNAALLKLNQLGYPLDPATNTIGKKAKSMLSCAMGKLNSD